MSMNFGRGIASVAESTPRSAGLPRNDITFFKKNIHTVIAGIKVKKCC